MDSPYEPVNSRLSDIFRLAPIIGKTKKKSVLRRFSLHPSVFISLIVSLVTCLSWDMVELQAVHALTEGYLCVKYISSLILSAICLFLRSFSPQQHCMLARSDLAWGAIVLSLNKPVDKCCRCRGWALLLLLNLVAVVDSFLLWLFESTCWKEWVRSSVSNVGEHDGHFSAHICVKAMLSRASRWGCYSLLQSHSVPLWSHSWDCCWY